MQTIDLNEVIKVAAKEAIHDHLDAHEVMHLASLKEIIAENVDNYLDTEHDLNSTVEEAIKNEISDRMNDDINSKIDFIATEIVKDAMQGIEFPLLVKEVLVEILATTEGKNLLKEILTTTETKTLLNEPSQRDPDFTGVTRYKLTYNEGSYTFTLSQTEAAMKFFADPSIISITKAFL
jgi:hypothetical protein